MTTKKWFYLQDETISGPFSVEEVQKIIISHPNCLLWGKGLTEWIAPQSWLQHMEFIKENPDVIEQENWIFKIQNQISSPLSKKNLLHQLKSHPQIQFIELSQDLGSSWKPLFSFPDIIEALGLTRRMHRRVPLMGTFEVSSYEDSQSGQAIEPTEPLVLHIVTLSEGGFGVSRAKGVNLGMKVKGLLKSPHLSMPFFSVAEAVYSGENQYLGFKFISLPHEGLSLIISYVNRFRENEVPQN